MALQNQFDEIEKNRLNLEQQKNMEREAIDNKLKTATQLRDENIKKMLERLKEHVSPDETLNDIRELIFVRFFHTKWNFCVLFDPLAKHDRQ